MAGKNVTVEDRLVKMFILEGMSGFNPTHGGGLKTALLIGKSTKLNAYI